MYSLRSLSESSILHLINKNDGVLICIHFIFESQERWQIHFS